MCTFVAQLPMCLIILFICAFAHHVEILSQLHDIIHRTDLNSQELAHLYEGRDFTSEEKEDGCRRFYQRTNIGIRSNVRAHDARYGAGQFKRFIFSF